MRPIARWRAKVSTECVSLMSPSASASAPSRVELRHRIVGGVEAVGGGVLEPRDHGLGARRSGAVVDPERRVIAARHRRFRSPGGRRRSRCGWSNCLPATMSRSRSLIWPSLAAMILSSAPLIECRSALRAARAPVRRRVHLRCSSGARGRSRRLRSAALATAPCIAAPAAARARRRAGGDRAWPLSDGGGGPTESTRAALALAQIGAATIGASTVPASRRA